MSIITPECILSYPNLREPQPNDQGTMFYQVTPIFTAETDISAIKQAVAQAVREKFGAEADGMIKNRKIRLPFRTDVESKGYPEGATFFSTKSKNAPGVVGLAPDSSGRPAPYEGEIYPGIIARISLQPYYYPQQGGGIAMGLRNVQILRDGERLDNRIPASQEFAADASASVADAGSADLNDLM